MRYNKITWGRGLLFLFALLWLVPLVWMLQTAFRPKQIALSPGFSLEFTLQNFATVWSAAPFAQYYFNTILIVVGVFAIQMVTATMAGFAFARVSFAGKNIVFLLFLVQLMVPADVLIFPNYTVLKELSLLDTKLGIMLPYFASAFGIFLLRQMFKTIPPELDEAAVMEGFSKWRIMWQIYFPLARPSYIAFGLVSVSYHWNNFLWPLIVTNSVENRPLTVGLAIFAQSYEIGAQWTEVSAATLLVIAPLMVGFLLFQRQFINSFIHSGIK
ncbi:carbohydrate ABC transporter permease [Paenibacillus vulneris]|uniref:Carbohydrate ABC transporter permease n=1 Tax=Paenibacillus vulneris TaxID=1133364 RepID=A0ABW3UDX6_9BACL